MSMKGQAGYGAVGVALIVLFFLIPLFIAKTIIFIVLLVITRLQFKKYKKNPSRKNKVMLALCGIPFIIFAWLMVGELSPILNFPALVYPELCSAQMILFPLQTVMMSFNIMDFGGPGGCYYTASALHMRPFGCDYSKDMCEVGLEGAISTGFQECASVEGKYFDESGCFLRVAEEHADVKSCERIVNVSSYETVDEERLSCIQLVVYLNNNTSCEGLLNPTYKEFCQKLKLSPSCYGYDDTVGDYPYNYKIIYCLAANNTDYSFCSIWEGIELESRYESYDIDESECKTFVSLHNNDIKGCESNEETASCMFSVLKKAFFSCPSKRDLVDSYLYDARLFDCHYPPCVHDHPYYCQYPGNSSNLEGLCESLSEPGNVELCQNISEFVVSECSEYMGWTEDEEKYNSTAREDCMLNRNCPCEYYLCTQWRGAGCNATIADYVE